MLNSSLEDHLNHQINSKIENVSRLSGGDINEVYLLHTTFDKIVIKINDSEIYPSMFEAEAEGLKYLSKSNSFQIPDVIQYGSFEKFTYLVLEYIPETAKAKNFWTIFAEKLALLHQYTEKSFGLEKHNYIGSLPQFNDQYDIASDFYIEQRLKPQFNMARERGFSFKDLDLFYKIVNKIIPNEAPSLVHGDLWSGNYIVGNDGFPVLIDPAVAFAPREMDLAMMHLFGGFHPTVFKIYHEIFPLEVGCQERQELFQLYYLLVHLNIFGSAYYSRCQKIIDSFTS